MIPATDQDAEAWGRISARAFELARILVEKLHRAGDAPSWEGLPHEHRIRYAVQFMRDAARDEGY